MNFSYPLLSIREWILGTFLRHPSVLTGKSPAWHRQLKVLQTHLHVTSLTPGETPRPLEKEFQVVQVVQVVQAVASPIKRWRTQMIPIETQYWHLLSINVQRCHFVVILLSFYENWLLHPWHERTMQVCCAWPWGGGQSNLTIWPLGSVWLAIYGYIMLCHILKKHAHTWHINQTNQYRPT